MAATYDLTSLNCHLVVLKTWLASLWFYHPFFSAARDGWQIEIGRAIHQLCFIWTVAQHFHLGHVAFRTGNSDIATVTDTLKIHKFKICFQILALDFFAGLMWDFVVALTLLVYSWGWNWWFLQLAPGNKARRGAPRHSLGRIPVHFETFQIQRNSSCFVWILGSNCNQISPIGHSSIWYQVLDAVLFCTQPGCSVVLRDDGLWWLKELFI